MNTTMNTGAASLLPCPFCGCSASPELNGNGIGDNWLECVECGASTRLREDGAGSVKDWNRRASTPQADAAPIINGHAINDLFLKWSEWTTELGEAISRKNIDGFVSELRAAIAAGGAQEADAHIQALVDAAKNVFELANHFNVSGVYFTEDDENRDALQALEDRIEAVDRSRS